MIKKIDRFFKIGDYDITPFVTDFSINETEKRLYHTINISINSNNLFIKCFKDYFEIGYIEDGYIEDGCNRSEVIDSYFQDGYVVNGYIEQTYLIEELQDGAGGYKVNFETVILNAVRNKDLPLYARIGTKEYYFYISEAKKNYKNIFEVIGGTKGLLMKEPFSISTTYSFSGSNQSIISSILDSFGINYTITNSNFNTGALELEDTTPLGVIEKLLQITNSSYYPINEDIKILPPLNIGENEAVAKVFNESEITNLKNEYIDNAGSYLKELIINPLISEIDSQPKITLKQDDKCVLPIVLFNPKVGLLGDAVTNLTSEIYSIVTTIEEVKIDNSKIVVVNGAIDSINFIKANGIEYPLANVTFEQDYNVIILSENITGTISVNYKTYALVKYKPYKNIANSTNDFNIKYLNQQLITSLPFSSGCGDGGGTGGGDDTGGGGGGGGGGGSGNCKVIVRGSPTKDTPTVFSVPENTGVNLVAIEDETQAPVEIGLQLGLIPPSKIKGYEQGATDFAYIDNSIYETETIGDRTTETITEAEVYGITRVGFYLDKNISISEIFIEGLTENFSSSTTVGDFEFYYKTAFGSNLKLIGKKATIYYNYTADVFTIPPMGLANGIKRYDIIACDGTTEVNFPDGEDDSDVVSCELPQTAKFDVANIIGVELSQAVGKTITSADFGSLTVDSFGKISIDITADGEFELDASSIVPNTTLVLKVNTSV